MKKYFFIVLLLISSFSFAFGQISSDSISMKKSFLGYQFYQAGERLTLNQLVRTMEPNEKAYQQIKSANTTKTLNSILGFAGGFLIGWPLGTALGGGEPKWTIVGIGAGLILVSIPLNKKFNKQAKQAVDTYNGGLQTSSFWNKSELRFSVTENGAGLTLWF